MFWRDKVVNILMGIGIALTLGFLLWVGLLQSALPPTSAANNLFIYPIIALAIFAGAVYFARIVYRSNHFIAYRILVTALFFPIILIALVYFAARQLAAG